METMMELMQMTLFALGCLMLATLLKSYRARILQYTADLVNKAEQAVQGSGMGEEKKALVIAQLEAAGIHVNRWLANWIDRTVDVLNANGAWLAVKTEQHTAGMVEDADHE